MPGVHGHTGHSQSHQNHLTKLQQLTMSQGVMNQTAVAVAAQQSAHHAVSHTPPPQKQTKSSKSRSGSSSGTPASVAATPAPHLLPGYPTHMNYPGHQVGQMARVGSSASQTRAPNVNIPSMSLDYYNAAAMAQNQMLNPLVSRIIKYIGYTKNADLWPFSSYLPLIKAFHYKTFICNLVIEE